MITRPDGSQTTLYTSTYYEGCAGHRGSDIFAYGLLDSNVDGFKARTQIRSHSDGGNTLTNQEVMAALGPRATRFTTFTTISSGTTVSSMVLTSKTPGGTPLVPLPRSTSASSRGGNPFPACTPSSSGISRSVRRRKRRVSSRP